MRHRVNGEEADLHHDADVSVHRVGDRLYVRRAGVASSAAVARLGEVTWVAHAGRVYQIEKAGARRHAKKAAGSGDAHAPMPGQVAAVLVEVGQAVEPGQKLLVLEAMKTQHPVLAPFAGIVRALPVTAGQQVHEGALLVRVEPISEA